MEENTNQPQKKSMGEVINEYREKNNIQSDPKTANIPKTNMSENLGNMNTPEQFQEMMQKETDPDLIISYEIIKLPSKGLFYKNNISELKIEYMTSKDEDLLTTPSLIDSGKVLDVLLKRKIKTKGIDAKDLLPGDRNAILLFLRSSSYGNTYTVTVPDPRTGISFETDVELNKLKYKEIIEMPDENGYFTVDLPMRKKTVKVRLISSGEDTLIFDKAQEIKEAYNNEFSEYNTDKLKAEIVSIDGKTDRTYINRFVDAMPALDSLTIKRKIMEVQPDVDMEYEFTAKDGFKFKAKLQLGVDFFFPSN